MYEVYRVIRPFIWNGYQYTPNKFCSCQCVDVTQGLKCTDIFASECESCKQMNCKCSCTMNALLHAGSIWIVEAGHPRKEVMLRSGFARGDATLPNIDELLRDEKYTRLLNKPEANPHWQESIELKTKKRTRITV